jgi:hypothetical protein
MGDSYGMAYTTRSSDEGYGERYGEAVKKVLEKKAEKEEHLSEIQRGATADRDEKADAGAFSFLLDHSFWNIGLRRRHSSVCRRSMFGRFSESDHDVFLQRSIPSMTARKATPLRRRKTLAILQTRRDLKTKQLPKAGSVSPEDVEELQLRTRSP